jgi:hypothetical protein
MNTIQIKIDTCSQFTLKNLTESCDNTDIVLLMATARLQEQKITSVGAWQSLKTIEDDMLVHVRLPENLAIMYHVIRYSIDFSLFILS